MKQEHREAEAEYLKEQLGELLSEKEENSVVTVSVTKKLFIEMAFCFIAKHGA